MIQLAWYEYGSNIWTLKILDGKIVEVSPFFEFYP